jgi:Molecular chaperone (small heat shock protein)
MNFNQGWMAELLELQKKAAAMGKNKFSADEVENLVVGLLSKWGITNLPLSNYFKYQDSSWAKQDTTEPRNSGHFDIDIAETKQQIRIEIIIPGIADQNDLAIRLIDNTLAISGKSSSFAENDGQFDRKIKLPAEVTAIGATATYRDQHLSITFPKREEPGVEIIPVDFTR